MPGSPTSAASPDEALWERLLASKAGRRGLRVMTAGGVCFSTWDDIIREAARRATVLRSRGVERGAMVAGVLNNSYDAVVGLFSVWFAEAGFASLPERSRGMSKTEYESQLSRIVDHSGSVLVLREGTSDTWADGTTDRRAPSYSWSSLDVAGFAAGDIAHPPLEGPVVVQYSSGSTSNPKGCMLRAGAIAAQEEILAEITEVARGCDVECSWVPLSHDMGLFGALVFACYNDIDLMLSSPERFMKSPRSWFADLSATGASITPGTNTALALAARAQKGVLPDRLQVRSGIIGAEAIDWHVLESMAKIFGPSGLSPTSLRPAYGMAEVTLAASCAPIGQRPRRLVVDKEALEHQVLSVVPDDTPFETTISLTSCGPAVPYTEVTSSRGTEIGELQVRSPSLAYGYLGQCDASTTALRDGVFRSSDVGFIHESEVYVLGRTDDVVIDAGRNVYLTEVESAVEDAINARKGRVTLVGVPDSSGPRLVAVVEVGHPPKNVEQLGGDVFRTVMARCGIPVAATIFIAKGQIPMTPSGKKQRHRCRQLLQRRQFDVLATTGDTMRFG